MGGTCRRGYWPRYEHMNTRLRDALLISGRRFVVGAARLRPVGDTRDGYVEAKVIMFLKVWYCFFVHLLLGIQRIVCYSRDLLLRV